MRWTVKLKTLLGTIVTVTAIAATEDDAMDLAKQMASDEANGILGAEVASIKP